MNLKKENVKNLMYYASSGISNRIFFSYIETYEIKHMCMRNTKDFLFLIRNDDIFTKLPCETECYIMLFLER